MDNNPINNLGVEVFLDSCLFDKGLKDLPKDLHDQMIKDLSARFQAWLLQACFSRLEEKDATELERLIETEASQEQILGFFRQRIPNIEKVFEQEMVNFKQAYLGAN